MMNEIFRVKYADCWIPESWVYAGGDKDKQVPIVLSVFLVKTENKMILVDAGCEYMNSLETANFDGPIKVLEKMGVAPEDITDVVITHAHHDHIACVKYFENATIYIQKDEYEKGKKYIPENFSLFLFEEECLIAEGVRCVKVGGHSKGSCVVEVACGDKQYVLCGDECYTFYNLKNKVPTGSSFCKEKSEEFIKHYGNGEYICLLCHDMETEV